MLLNAKADPDARNSVGRCALTTAIASNHLKVVNCLLLSGADTADISMSAIRYWSPCNISKRIDNLLRYFPSQKKKKKKKHSILSTLSEEETRKFRQLFDFYDGNQDGIVTFEDLFSKLNISRFTARSMIDHAVINKQLGQMTFEDFVKMTKTSTKPPEFTSRVSSFLQWADTSAKGTRRRAVMERALENLEDQSMDMTELMSSIERDIEYENERKKRKKRLQRKNTGRRGKVTAAKAATTPIGPGRGETRDNDDDNYSNHGTAFTNDRKGKSVQRGPHPFSIASQHSTRGAEVEEERGEEERSQDIFIISRPKRSTSNEDRKIKRREEKKERKNLSKGKIKEKGKDKGISFSLGKEKVDGLRDVRNFKSARGLHRPRNSLYHRMINPTRPPNAHQNHTNHASKYKNKKSTLDFFSVENAYAVQDSSSSESESAADTRVKEMKRKSEARKAARKAQKGVHIQFKEDKTFIETSIKDYQSYRKSRQLGVKRNLTARRGTAFRDGKGQLVNMANRQEAIDKYKEKDDMFLDDDEIEGLKQSRRKKPRRLTGFAFTACKSPNSRSKGKGTSPSARAEKKSGGQAGSSVGSVDPALRRKLVMAEANHRLNAGSDSDTEDKADQISSKTTHFAVSSSTKKEHSSVNFDSGIEIKSSAAPGLKSGMKSAMRKPGGTKFGRMAGAGSQKDQGRTTFFTDDGGSGMRRGTVFSDAAKRSGPTRKTVARTGARFADQGGSSGDDDEGEPTFVFQFEGVGRGTQMKTTRLEDDKVAGRLCVNVLGGGHTVINRKKNRNIQAAGREEALGITARPGSVSRKPPKGLHYPSSVAQAKSAPRIRSLGFAAGDSKSKSRGRGGARRGTTFVQAGSAVATPKKARGVGFA